jgi:hypothetical protein
VVSIFSEGLATLGLWYYVITDRSCPSLFVFVLESLYSIATMPAKKKFSGRSTTGSAPATSGDDRALFRDVELMSYPELQERKRQIDERLKDISIPDALIKRPKYFDGGSGKGISQTSPTAYSRIVTNEVVIPYTTKTDTHWDFVIKGKERQVYKIVWNR